MAADQNNAVWENTGPIHPLLVDFMAGRQDRRWNTSGLQNFKFLYMLKYLGLYFV